jgi:hypothetical protein
MTDAQTPTTNPTAAEAIADGAPIPFDFEGVALFVKPTTHWGMRGLDRLERGFITSWLELVLAGDSYGRLLNLDPDPETLSRIVTTVQKAAGVKGN